MGSSGSRNSFAVLTKKTTAEAVVFDHVLDRVENGQEAPARVLGTVLDFLHGRVAPGFVGAAYTSEYEFLLGAEMIVESHLGATGCFEDAIDAGGAESVLLKQCRGTVEEALPFTHCHTVDLA